MPSKVFIATPAHSGEVTTAYTYSLCSSISDLKQNGYEVELFFLNYESVISKARNIVVSKFLESDCTHLMFIDGDMAWPKDAVRKLIETKKDLVAAAGVRKSLPVSFCTNLEITDGKATFCATTNCIRVNEVGTGFMLITKRVVDRLVGAAPNRWYYENSTNKSSTKIYILFENQFDEETKDNWSEDYAFCRNWRKLGGEVWVDPSIALGHYGKYNYEGKLQDELDLSQQAAQKLMEEQNEKASS